MANVTTLVVSLLFMISLSALAQKGPPPFKSFTTIAQADTLPYRLGQPTKIIPQEKYPLLIFLHGAGERGNDNERQLKHISVLFSIHTLNKYPCFILAPQCPRKQNWSDLMAGKPFNTTPTKPMELLIQTMHKLIKEYPIDPSRIYITGLSMGGFGTWDLIMRYPNTFAAAVPICGGGDEKMVSKIKHIPLWVFHGALDEVVPPQKSRVMVYALQAAGALPGYTEYPDVAHNSWMQAYKEPHLMHWLFKQRLPDERLKDQ